MSVASLDFSTGLKNLLPVLTTYQIEKMVKNDDLFNFSGEEDDVVFDDCDEEYPEWVLLRAWVYEFTRSGQGQSQARSRRQIAARLARSRR